MSRAKRNNTLAALGGAHPDAMSGLATGAKGNEREQDVHTPDSIIEVVRQAFGGIIFLDPCASKTREPFAENNATEDDNGLEYAWTDRTYFNPPYKMLKAWLAHAAKQDECIGLYPVRTNRVWWMKHHIESVDVIAWLKPLTFVGYKGAFPAPLVLTLRGGSRIEAFKRAVELSGLAHAVTGPLTRV